MTVPSVTMLWWDHLLSGNQTGNLEAFPRFGRWRQRSRGGSLGNSHQPGFLYWITLCVYRLVWLGSACILFLSDLACSQHYQKKHYHSLLLHCTHIEHEYIWIFAIFLQRYICKLLTWVVPALQTCPLHCIGPRVGSLILSSNTKDPISLCLRDAPNLLAVFFLKKTI